MIIRIRISEPGDGKTMSIRNADIFHNAAADAKFRKDNWLQIKINNVEEDITVKIAKSLLIAGMALALLAGCGNNANNGNTGNTNTGTTNNGNTNTGNNTAGNGEADAMTTPSIVNQPDAFVNAVSEQGTWIIATLNDLTIDQEVTVAGTFHDKGAADGDIYRKIALYAQDENHNITASYTLTVPQLTVKSENLRIQGGTVKGDVLVDAPGFNLDKTATIDGNLYFTSDDVKSSAAIDGKVTGKNEVKQ